MSTLSSLKLGLVAALLASSALVGCGGPEARDASAVRFSMTSGAAVAAGPATARIVDTRVLATRLDFRQPLDVQKSGNRIDVKFGVRQLEGATYRLDPRSLATTATTSFVFERSAAPDESYYLRTDSAYVALDDTRSIAFATDESTGRVVARFDGSELPISSADMAVMGPPRAAAIDERHVVVAYYATTQTGCALVASTIEVSQ